MRQELRNLSQTSAEDRGSNTDPLAHWDGQEEKLELLADGDYGRLSDIAQQLLRERADRDDQDNEHNG